MQGEKSSSKQAQASPTYAMQCFAIPVSILNELESMLRKFIWGQRKDERKLAWVAWEKLYESKAKGGLGMRNLTAFNKALLAKQAWRIIKFPESLMAKTLASKYFPHNSFMEAKPSPEASFTWKSILLARDLLQKGLKIIVGLGANVAIWDDPWIPSLPNFRAFGPDVRTDDSPRVVRELMKDGQWSEEKLNHLFSQWEIVAIRSIPLPTSPCSDKWA